ncbi:MAG: hypothetical protein R6X16_10075 [Anaerolineae bacterium]
MSKSRRSSRRGTLFVIGGILLLCAVMSVLSSAANRRLAALPVAQSDLTALDMSRWQEAVHLRQVYGSSVWPGWADADIPLILYNEEYAFLLGLPQPEAGWTTVPGNRPQGARWEPVSDLATGSELYRQRLTGDEKPQAFAMFVGDRWVAGMTTKDALVQGFARGALESLPSAVRPLVPAAWLAALVLDSDQYIAAISHEAFHAFQGLSAPERLWAAESAGAERAATYPWEDDQTIARWQEELTLLREALEAEDGNEMTALARQFIEHRQNRRVSLTPDLVEYEQEREWAEGLARYAELEIWRLPSLDAGYQPVTGMADDPAFHAYRGFDARWDRELPQMARMANDEGDGRFYYSGMAQAYLLDRLSPGWKQSAFRPGAYLDDLLAAAIAQSP